MCKQVSVSLPYRGDSHDDRHDDYSCAKSVLNDPSFPDSAPFAKEFLTSMGMVVDFWAEPSYAQLLQAEQKRVHDYVVADKGSAQEALDGLVKDWKAVFKEEGKKF
jgi:multiple sugar transport system substrate-binding protein